MPFVGDENRWTGISGQAYGGKDMYAYIPLYIDIRNRSTVGS